jgi:hypothetical protein
MSWNRELPRSVRCSMEARHARLSPRLRHNVRLLGDSPESNMSSESNMRTVSCSANCIPRAALSKGVRIPFTESDTRLIRGNYMCDVQKMFFLLMPAMGAHTEAVSFCELVGWSGTVTEEGCGGTAFVLFFDAPRSHPVVRKVNAWDVKSPSLLISPQSWSRRADRSRGT